MSTFAEYKESGNRLPVVSLGGVLSQPGNGRISSCTSVMTATDSNLATDNSHRISAIIQNIDDTVTPGSYAVIYLGGLNTQGIVLAPYGTFQIDINYPWTGAIYAMAAVGFGAGGNPVVVITEVSVV